MRNTRRLMALAATFASFVSFPANAADSVDESRVRSVAEALELPYMKIYSGSSCRALNVKDRWYIKCSPSGDIIGGLWAVAPGPVLVAVNGKAKQHAGKLEGVVENDLNTVPIKEWRDVYPGEVPDVAPILDAYK